jgi:hypothetical protein
MNDPNFNDKIPNDQHENVKKAIEALSSLNVTNQPYSVSLVSLAVLLNRTVNNTIDLLMKVKPQRISTLKFTAEEEDLSRIITHFLGQDEAIKFKDSYNDTETTNSYDFSILPAQLNSFGSISLFFVLKLVKVYKRNKRRNGQFYRRKSVLDFFTRRGGKRLRRLNTKKRRTRQRM